MSTKLPRALCFMTLVLGLGALASTIEAQDLQPGRNYPAATAALGTDKTQEFDVGDVDLDVLSGNGAHGCFCIDRIFINQGGMQGGQQGTFVDETDTRFAGFPAEKGRDIEFVDYDLDGDLDVFVSNRGSNVVSVPSRFYTNLGGQQGGTIGFFVEETEQRWGTLVSVDADDQVLGGDVGPFYDDNRDADFGDLDLDGDPDLFLSAQGPNFNGTSKTRVFLNDGTGVFHELWPWADAAADVQLHAIESQIVDLDGDLDLDAVVSSRDSQSRAYVNNLIGGPTSSAFEDVTQSALLANGAVQSGNSSYGVEIIDADRDDDFDLWMVNYDSFADRLLENLAPGGVHGLAFTEQVTWIENLPNVDNEGASVVDYDNDGDLDMFIPNFSGTNFIYRNRSANGGPVGFTRTGVGAEPPETPASLNGGTTLDGEAADLDGDGDLDLLLANDGNQQNRVWFNELGEADTHAPTVVAVESVADRPIGFDARVVAQVRDNEPWAIIAFHAVELLYSVDGGPTQSVAMTSAGGQQFVGFLPGNAAGTVDYAVQVIDGAGNVGVSSSQQFVQGLPTPWENLGFAHPGTNGAPRFEGRGLIVAGTSGELRLTSAAPHRAAVLFIGLGAGAVPFKGGTFVPIPLLANQTLQADPWGRVTLAWASWPAGLAPGTELVMQVWIDDPAASKGVAGSNAVRAVTP